MGEHTPIVSIGLPVYNGANFVADAIKAVSAQTFADWELVIVDNASTDRTLEICNEFAASDSRIRVHRNERNRGITPNYNRAFRLSRGRYFGWLAHDDMIGAEFIESCVELLERDPATVLAFPKIVHTDAHFRVLRRQELSDLSIVSTTAASRVRRLMDLEIQGTDIFWSQFGLIRRTALERTQVMGLYSGSDQSLLLQLALQGNLRQIQKDLFFRREHPGASTLRNGWTARERARLANADDSRMLVFPYCRLLLEHVASVHRSRVPMREKLACDAAIGRRFLNQWRYFVRELVGSPLEAWQDMKRAG